MNIIWTKVQSCDKKKNKQQSIIKYYNNFRLYILILRITVCFWKYLWSVSSVLTHFKMSYFLPKILKETHEPVKYDCF